MSRAVGAAVGTSLLVYLTLAVSGYVTFGPSAVADILVQYPNNGPVTCCRAAIAVLVLFSYPLQTAPCRQHVLHLFAHLAPHTVRRHYSLWFTVRH